MKREVGCRLIDIISLPPSRNLRGFKPLAHLLWKINHSQKEKVLILEPK